MDVDVITRHCEVSDRFRQHAEDKLAKLEKYDNRVARVDVEVSHERNPRLSAQSYRVELTLHSKGPVVRAEGASEDKVAALDMALDRLEAQLRKAADRRRVHHGRRTPPALDEALPREFSDLASDGQAPADADAGVSAATLGSDSDADGAPAEHMEGPLTVQGDGPLAVHEKEHPAVPMTLDQALSEMELVGHDFYLFIDKDTDQAAVVYRRHGYDYGVIRLTS